MTPSVALALAGAGALSARLMRALSWRGAATAFVVALATCLAAGWSGAAALAAFFVSGSVLARVEGTPTQERARSAGQVLANGGPAAAVAALAALAGYHEAALWGAAAGLSAASADTWATGFGATASVPPRHLLTGQPVSVGTSGGVTLRGTIGALPGAMLVAGAAAAVHSSPRLLVTATILGMAGMLADSTLGAAWQAQFRCELCDIATERRQHCGQPARNTGGWRWLTNNEVNALAGAGAAAAGAALSFLLA